jgi:hypothetical protein
VTKSRNAALPADRLPGLNARISHPLELRLKRALLRDYPNLAGLFILLRVMNLLVRFDWLICSRHSNALRIDT